MYGWCCRTVSYFSVYLKSWKRHWSLPLIIFMFLCDRFTSCEKIWNILFVDVHVVSFLHSVHTLTFAILTFLIISFIKHSFKTGGLLMTNSKCRVCVFCLALEGTVNDSRYAKHVSFISETICLCAAISLRRNVLDCPESLSLRRSLPVGITDHHADGCQPGGCSRRALSTPTLTHTIKCAHTSTVIIVNKTRPQGTEGLPSQWQIGTQSQAGGFLWRDSGDLSQGDPVQSCSLVTAVTFLLHPTFTFRHYDLTHC